MKKYTIIGGVYGVGKSSLSGVLSAENTDLGSIIDTNKITAECSGDRIKGGKIAESRINECIAQGVNFTEETTLSGVRTVKTIKKARELDYKIRLYYVGVDSAEESLERIANRVRKGGHDILAEDVYSCFSKRFDDLVAVLPFCDEALFFDNENGFVVIAEYRNGILTPKSNNLPKWIIEFGDHLTSQGNGKKSFITSEILRRKR